MKGPGLKSEDVELIESLLTPDWQRWEAEIRRLNTAYRAGLKDAKKK